MSGLLAGRTDAGDGGGAGIGRAVALAGADEGAAVVVASPGDNGGATADAIRTRGGSARWVRCDVTQRATSSARSPTRSRRPVGST